MLPTGGLTRLANVLETLFEIPCLPVTLFEVPTFLLEIFLGGSVGTK